MRSFQLIDKVVLSGIPSLPFAVVSIGPLSADVPQAIAVRIIIGAIITSMGYKAYQTGKD